ncbi:helix-turn-helix domain-containing protein [Algoriphagus litoralis]|uniref:helix-turn-helix domain-containing protein n=1 Tax=Algoriphagus litoralis TaxID=2202829 RepID=UPI000DBACA30|nr:helix-turn-helix domain-containing protein [Algoriphagus litoralis]
MSFFLIPSIILLAFSAFSSILLIAKGDNKTCQMRFFGGTLLIYSLFFLTYGLWFEFELVLKYPHVLRSFSPVLFLAGPFFYFSIRNLVHGKTGFGKKDWMHFLPAIVHFVELIPLYSLPLAEKLQIADKVLSEEGGLSLYSNGLIPGIWVDLFRLALIIIYFSYSMYLVFTVNPMLLKQLKQEKFKNWVFGALVFFGVIQFFYLVQYVHNVQYFFTGVSFPELRTFLVLLMLLSILVFNLYNFMKLELNLELAVQMPIVGIKQSALTLGNHHMPVQSFQIHLEAEEEESKFNERELKEKLTKLLDEDQIFLKPGLLVSEFSRELGITPRCLPEILEKIYGKGFKDLINQYRVSYAKEKIESGYLDVFTLESLGKVAGFNSRTTFFNAFKKELNVSPSDFWKRYQEGPIQED